MKKLFNFLVCVLFLPYSLVQLYGAPTFMQSKGFIGSTLVSGGVLGAVSWWAYRRMKKAEKKKKRAKYARIHKICGAIATGALSAGVVGAFSQKPMSQKSGQVAGVAPLAPGQVDSYLSMSDSDLHQKFLVPPAPTWDPLSLVIKSGDDEAGKKFVEKLVFDPTSQCAQLFPSMVMESFGRAMNGSMPKTATAIIDGLFQLKGRADMVNAYLQSTGCGGGLFTAARDPLTIDFLVARGLDVDLKYWNRTPLQNLLSNRYCDAEGMDEMCAALIRNGATLGPIIIFEWDSPFCSKEEYEKIWDDSRCSTRSEKSTEEIELLPLMVAMACPKALGALMRREPTDLKNYVDKKGRNLLPYCTYRTHDRHFTAYGVRSYYCQINEAKKIYSQMDEVVQILLGAGVDSTTPAVQETAKKAPEGSKLRRLVLRS